MDEEGSKKRCSSESLDEKPSKVNKTEEAEDGHPVVWQPEDLEVGDPFRLQYEYELSPDLLNSLSAKPPLYSSTTLTWPALGCLRFYSPQVAPAQPSSAAVLQPAAHAAPRHLVEPPAQFSLDKLHVRGQIVKNYQHTSQRFLHRDITALQKELFSIVCNYQDLYFTERSFSNGEEVRLVYSTHAVNHALKTRLNILHNNSNMSQGKDHDVRDHGLVRPKVLILVPFKDSALRIIKMMMSVLVGDGGNVENKKRFLSQFSGETLRMPQRNPKPADYQHLFFGNTDDNFKIGLSLAKKSLKLYVDFYRSDIIVASPLGLRTLMGAARDRDNDYDFLSSIELFIMDQAEVLVMQNWEHVLHIVGHMHLVPRESHGTDLTRVRMWALNGWSKYYTQHLVFASHPLPEISAFFNINSRNFSGRVVVMNPVVGGTISQVIVPVPQVFHELGVESVSASVETRFQEFLSKFLPQFSDPLMKHTLIYVPSYFDFVKIRNHFKKQDISFVQICEYTKEGKIARARDLFYHGEVHFMLYSERFHFFRRIRLKGIRHLLFYQPPAFPHFYSELSNLVQELKGGRSGESELSITVLYTKYDVAQLSCIVGTDRATRMIASDKNVHMFMTND